MKVILKSDNGEILDEFWVYRPHQPDSRLMLRIHDRLEEHFDCFESYAEYRAARTTEEGDDQ